MTFLANSNLILQISHVKTFKIRYARCQYNKSYPKILRECGSSGEDVSVNAVIIPRNWGQYLPRLESL